MAALRRVEPQAKPEAGSSRELRSWDGGLRPALGGSFDGGGGRLSDLACFGSTRRSLKIRLPEPPRAVNGPLCKRAGARGDPSLDRRAVNRNAARGEKVGEVSRQRGDESQPRAGAWMAERQRERMQRLTSKRRRLAVRVPPLASAVERVAETGMADRGEVDTDLMGAAGQWTHANQRCLALCGSHPRKHGDFAYRFAPARRAYRHPLTLDRMASNGARDQKALTGDAPTHNRQIQLVHRTFLELARELHARIRRARDRHHARSALVEAMHDTGAHHAVRLRHHGHL